MYKNAERRLARLAASGCGAMLAQGLVGLEKESLRVTPDGILSPLPHPAQLGAALTHPSITTDYSEALLEFVTEPSIDKQAVLGNLETIHRYVYSCLGSESLWVNSMPCVLEGDSSIPIAQYGNSNVGRMKHVYRRGLAWRYGRTMQAIAGIHFNYSVAESLWPVLQDLEQDRRPAQDFINDWYFRLIRNIQRIGWVVPLLFGASPAVCKSFFNGEPPDYLQVFDASTWYSPFATSLRMSDIGYHNSKDWKAGARVPYNSLESYARELIRSIRKPHPPYEKIGVYVDEEYRQLNANVLQIENEYYSTLRAKQPVRSGERPTTALLERGVRYIELRSLDLNPFEPVGINLAQLYFLEVLCVLCLLHDSPPVDMEQRYAINQNHSEVALAGRQRGLQLRYPGGPIDLEAWLTEIFKGLTAVAEIMDQAHGDQRYSSTVASQRALAMHPEGLPSARLIEQMQQRKLSFYAFAMDVAASTKAYFDQRPPSGEEKLQFRRLAEHSLQQQRAIEDADNISFEEYLARYYA